MKKTKKLKTAPVCVGTGLIALDVIMNGDPSNMLKIHAGGSCGNVLTILSFLGWDSYPIARLGNNPAAQELVSDLKKCKVKTRLVATTSDGSTPIIIQRIKKDRQGNYVHRFEFRNPENGEYLPSYKPVLGADVEHIVKKQPKAKVFYFDRSNRASIDFAKYYKKQGALIYFEPSSSSEIRLFEESLAVADIVKFSNDRIRDYSSVYPIQKVPLEIETLGKDGVRFRFSHRCNKKEWISLKGYNISNHADAAGAGDWTSAGIISKIGTTGVKGFQKLTAEKIKAALEYGQALGALNCLFDGARGLMYSCEKANLNGMVKALTAGNETSIKSSKKQKSTGKRLTIGSLY
jgi:fructokinase